MEPITTARPLTRPAPSLAVLLTALLAIAVAVLAPAPAAHAMPPASVQVLDTVDVVEDDQSLTTRLEGVDLRESVDLVALTVDVTDHGASTGNDRALNDAVLELARSEHPGWISGDTWADGLVVIAIDPENRLVGTYAGEDVKLSDGGFEDVQDAMKDPARDGEWADALTAGAEEYAALLGRPWWQGPGPIIGAVLALVAAGAAVIAALARGARSRSTVRTARERHEDVRAKRRETDQAAARIPRHSTYGATILADVEDYRRAVDGAETIEHDLPARPGPLWGIGAASAAQAKEYRDAVAVADAADDTIIGAAQLLGRTGDHRGAWQEERRPLDESLAAVEDTIREAGLGADEPSAAADGLRATAREVAGELEDVSRDYLAGTRSPDECLAQLDALTERLAVASGRVREEVIGIRATDEDEAGIMRDAGPEGFVSEFPTSVRGRRAARHPQDYAADYTLSPVLWTGAWYSGATSALDVHRNPPSSSGSTSGYSGGGFSGAGSSSSF